MIEEWEKAWLAGILDFQGHVQKKNNKERAPDSRQIMIYVDTGIDEIITRLGQMTGGNVELKTRHKINPARLRKQCAEHCPEEHVHMAGPFMPFTGRWAVTGAACAIVLWNVRQYMSTETREPWDWALKTCLSQLKLSGRGATAVQAAARRLDALGWELPPVMRRLLPRELEAAR